MRMPVDSRRGTRCRICTGCGRCFQEKEGTEVLAEGGLLRLWQERIAEQRKRAEQAGDQRMPEWVIAADVGTTTIAMILYDGQARERSRYVSVNPQREYGADVISRIQASADRECAEKLRISVCGALEAGVERFRKIWEAEEHQERERAFVPESGTQKAVPRPPEMVIAANTAMCYLLLGYDAGELGRAPFRASHLEQAQTRIAGLEATVLPGLSAFVGADIMAGICACGMAEQEKITLLIDLGTNGEMAIGSRGRILACATAAGPAFEGGATSGIWGADMVHLTARLLREGVLDETGLLADPFFEEGIRIGGVELRQSHIRQLQLAKGAVAAGIGSLVSLYGLDSAERIDRVVLAGGFGVRLDPKEAAGIGLLPENLVKKAEGAGNTALAGALRFGFCRKEAEALCREIAAETRAVNLAEEAGFQERFVEAMSLEAWRL